MTSECETELCTAIYALGDAVKSHNWPDAVTLWERLLLLYSPLADWQPELSRVLRRNALMVHMAERQTSRIH